jgi:hypothetical protein
MQGRIKRQQAERQTRQHLTTSAENVVCPLCERPIPPAQRDAHHLVPKSRGGVATVFLHRVCHRQVHAVLTETELARHYDSPDALLSHPEIARFIDWVRDKPVDFNPPTRRSREKGRLRITMP